MGWRFDKSSVVWNPHIDRDLFRQQNSGKQAKEAIGDKWKINVLSSSSLIVTSGRDGVYRRVTFKIF